MIYNLYSIKDAKSCYMPCTPDRNDACAVRNFEHAVRQPDSLLASHPNDYSLFRVGQFDDETGVVVPEAPVLLCDASACLRKE